jgi:predicted esterase
MRRFGSRAWNVGPADGNVFFAVRAGADQGDRMSFECKAWVAVTLAFAAFHAAMVFAGPSPWAAGETGIPYLKDMTVGDTPADWQGKGLVVHALAGDGADIASAAVFGAVGRLGWNEQGILLQVDVTDPTPRETENTDRLYEGDSIELCLMREDATGGMVQVIAAPGRTDANPTPRVKVFDYRERPFKLDAPPFAPKVARRLTDRGYVMDLLLPWESMKITPAEGAKIGLRFSVTNADGEKRYRGLWLNGQGRGEWMKLSTVRLAAEAGTPCPTAVWCVFDEFTAVVVNAVAEPELAGQSVYVLEDGVIRSSATLTLDGQRATASVRWPMPPPGKKLGSLAVQIAGVSSDLPPMPDLDQLRKETFQRGAAAAGRRMSIPAWQKPACEPAIFSSEQFPACAYPQPEKIRNLVGEYKIETVYFDDAQNRLTRPAGPGRYGAVSAITSSTGDSLTVYQTLYRSAPGATTQPADTPQSLHASASQMARFQGEKYDRDWWHSLRNKLGLAIRYEYFVRLPTGYDADPNKRWPVIVFLHGSGGGENLAHVLEGGVQVAARNKSDFPFIAVSLRSPGGWSPPAVVDVIQAVKNSCRTDDTRFYLTGFSMGGMGTWSVALDSPQAFAAIAPVGGSRGDPTQAARLKGLGIWVINGADDTATTSADAMQMVEALKQAGVDAKFTEIPNADHVDSLRIAYDWDELYAWFLQHQRAEAGGSASR